MSGGAKGDAGAGTRGRRVAYGSRFTRLLLALLTVFVSMNGERAHAAPVSARALNPDFERLLEVRSADHEKIVDALPAYELGGTWFLPIGELSAALGYSIQVIGERGEAVTVDKEGFFLSLKDCFARRNSQRHDLKSEGKAPGCTLALPLDDEIYLAEEVWEDLFGLTITVNSFDSSLVIASKDPLPFQLRRDVEERREAVAKKADRSMKAPDNTENDGTLLAWSGPFWDQTLQFENRASPQESHREFSANGHMSNSLHDWAQDLRYRFDTDLNLFDHEFTVSRRDPEGRLGGALGAREMEAGDLRLPSLSLVSTGRRGQGAHISSFDLEQADNFGAQTLRGFTRPGWDVELYLNGVLLDSRKADPLGAYEFSNVGLAYGNNVVDLKFYGPSGEIETDHRVYNVDLSQNQAGRFSYDAALQRGNDKEFEGVARAQYGLSANTTLEAGWARADRTYGQLGVRSFFADQSLSATAATTPSGGWAGTGEWLSQFGRLRSSVEAFRFDHYESDFYRRSDAGNFLTSIYRASSALPFTALIPFSVRGGYEERRYLQNERVRNWQLTLSAQRAPFYFQNSFRWYPDQHPAFDGDLFLSWNRNQWGARYEESYTTRGPLAYLAEISRTLYARTATALVRWTRDQTTHDDAALIGFVRDFRPLRWGFNVSHSTHDLWIVNTEVGLSLARDGRPPTRLASFASSSEELADDASVSIRLFNDENQNLRWDPGEELLEGVKLVDSQTSESFQSDAAGRIFWNHLEPYRRHEFKIVEETLADPTWRSSKEVYVVYPARAATTALDVAVLASYEVEGVVQIDRGTESVMARSAGMRLMDEKGAVREVRTDSDGYYVLEGLWRGTYRLSLDPQLLELRGLEAEPAEALVTIDENSESVLRLPAFHLKKSKKKGAPP